ncbi:sensor histidine kinase [Glycomyces salinus]|uniref:sensor histidine kinase n=1 Tax=Glycomyces salinus TaxID=980294 RepID=UPI0018ED8937|nr:sensor histidine kinase [Glycomyces salinus]
MFKRLPIGRRDLALAIALAVLIETLAVLRGEPLPPWAWIVLGISPVALMFRRAFPRTVMGVAIGCMLVLAHLQFGALTILPALVAIGTAMYTGYRAWTISAVFAVSAFAALSFWQGADRQLNAEVVRNTLLVVGWLHVAMITGESRRQRDAYMEEAEHTKEEAVRRKAADERVRIARELHDSLTHSISVIRVQAGVAIHLARKRGEQPPEALVVVEEAAKDATSELRETLTMLRGDEGPRLARVKELAARYEGLGFDLEIDCLACDEVDVAPEVDHAAYRIVQEALTNAVRHSGGDRVTVTVAHDRGELAIEVFDNGTPGGFEPGRGITGMRERVDSLGGELAVGPTAGGFAVRVRLPARADVLEPQAVDLERIEQ